MHFILLILLYQTYYFRGSRNETLFHHTYQRSTHSFHPPPLCCCNSYFVYRLYSKMSETKKKPYEGYQKAYPHVEKAKVCDTVHWMIHFAGEQ